MSREAEGRETKFGQVYDTDGWFVINAHEARWSAWERMGVYCNFEGKKRFPQLGFNVDVLQPGDSLGLYHMEKAQEDFLVLAGRCVMVVEEQEQKLGPWDFFHCPPGVPHMLVAVGDEPAVVIAVGARGRGRSGIRYLVSEAAARRGVSVSKETTDPSVAYADLGRPTRVRYGEGWLPDL